MNKRQEALRQHTVELSIEIHDLEKAAAALRQAIHTSYSLGAAPEFVDGLDTTLASIRSRISQLESLRSERLRELETRIPA